MSNRRRFLRSPLVYIAVLIAVAMAGGGLLVSSAPAQATFGECAIADTLVSYTPGPGSGSDTDPLTDFDGNVISLGTGGEIVVQFTTTSVIDGPGNDFLLGEDAEASTGEVLVSSDGVNFVSLGLFTRPASSGQIDIDLDGSGVASFTYVKIIAVDGFDLDVVEALNCSEPDPTPTPDPSPTPSPTPDPSPTPTPDPSPTPTPEPSPTPTATPTTPAGGEGCTPGYWKQKHHFDSWVDFAPDDSFEAVFGVDASFNGTLLGALKRGGGGEKALGRHAVAALLNSSSDVESSFTVAQVIQAVQNAYSTGNFEGLKNTFEKDNESGCPLN